MHLAFIDDSLQTNPSRQGMGPIASVGAVLVNAESFASLESSLEAVCSDHGFPPGEEFKWSPGRELWMHGNLVDQQRFNFFGDILTTVQAHDVTSIVVIADTQAAQANRNATSHQMDVLMMLLERIDNALGSMRSHALLVADRPGGGAAEERSFLLECLEIVLDGTSYVPMNRIPINVLTTSSRWVRTLQVADVVTSCLTAFVGGEDSYSPAVAAAIKPTLRREYQAVGGRGVKIHPDFRYANLYHWLFGDTHLVRNQGGVPLPLHSRPYADDPLVP